MNQSQKNENLDIVRSLACIMVVMVHLNQNVVLPDMLSRIFSFGGYGVDIFFFLSGFLAYDSFERRTNGKFNAKVIWDYYLVRIARIIPLYYLFVVFYFVLSKTGFLIMPIDESSLGWLRYFLLINLWIPSSEPWMNLQGLWCVSVFVLFYMLLPLYYKLFRSFKSSIVGFCMLYVLNVSLRHTFLNRSPLIYLYIFAFGIVVDRAIKEAGNICFHLLYIASMAFLFLQDKEGWVVLFLSANFILGTTSHYVKFDKNKIEEISMIVLGKISEYSYTVYFVHLAVILIMNHLFDEISIFKNGGVINNYLYICIFAIATMLLSLLLQKKYVQLASHKILSLIKD